MYSLLQLVMEEFPQTMTTPLQTPLSAHQWTDILKHGAIAVLAALVFISIILYFRELVLLIRFAFIGWIALIFVFLMFVRSFYLVSKSTRQWYTQQVGMSKLFFILILIVLIIFGVFSFVIIVEKLQPVYGDRFLLLHVNTLPSYLSFQKNSVHPADVAREIHRLVNEERVAHQVSVLSYDSALEMIAQAHSNDMVANVYFEHINSRGEDAISRGNRAGYPCKKDQGIEGNIHTESAGIGENLARTPLGNVEGCGSVYDAGAIARCTVEGWMQSEEHRKNILTAIYDSEGIGVMQTDRDFYITQNFC